MTMQVWTHELDTHLDHTEDRTQLAKIEQQILHEYNEIKADIEENEVAHDLTFTRPFSSYLIPKDSAHYGRERRLYLERLGHVPTVPDVSLLSHEFEEELNTCSSTKSDYSPESLPLLIQTFYLKRLSSLTYAKTLHTVRWKRFCRQQIEYSQVEQQFNDRSARILAEFNDALQRSHRLSSVRETLLLPSSAASKNTNQALVNDDYVAYIRYLVCQYRGQKYFDQLAELIHVSHLKFRTRLSTDTQSLTINLQPPPSPFQTTTALYRIPSIDLDQKQTIERLNILFSLYSLPLDTSKIRTAGDEMELYANIIRHYRIIFSEQEKEHVSIPYESAKPKVIAHARQSSSCKLLKKSSWINFVTLTPERDPQRERDYWKYIKNGKNDELLMKITQFLHVRNADKAANALKQYLLALKAKKTAALRQVLESSATNATRAVAMSDIFWKNIFDLNSENGNNNEGDNDKDNNDDNDDLHDSYDFQDTPARSNRFMRRDEFNYLETLQKLGLDDTSGQVRDNDAESNDASESYGLQLSYLTLRLLRIRTLRHRCLNEFNYLRSIQRTLTIYEQRLTITSKGKDLQIVDQRFNNYVPHTYLFNTPHECTLETLDYMQSGEHNDNIEDFAHEALIANDGSIIHVQDSTGIYIIYDCAQDDVHELEQEIVSIGSYFIEKASLKSQKTSEDSEYVKKIDRFEILYNLWDYELTYLQYKRQLIDCYYEIYQHTFDQDERHVIAQTIMDLNARRPRIDFRSDDYFAHSYSLEIRFLKQYLSLLREYIDRHVNDMRDITENLFDATDYGAYFPSTRSQSSPPIYLSASKIHSYHLFEFLESFSSLTRLPHLWKKSVNELFEFEQLQRQSNLSLTDKLVYELDYLDDILSTYKQLDQPGTMFSSNQQRDVFNTLYSDHPTMMGKLAYEVLKQVDEARTTKKEQYEKYLKLNTNLIELLTLRYRLIRSASECELLTTVYKQQLDIMSIDHSHLFLRFIQFEFAQSRNLPNVETENGSISTPIADGRLDKITGQQHLLFAVQELEEGSIGRINFRQKDQWLTYMNDADEAISNLKTALRLQLMHNHFVYTAILQHRLAIVCITQQLQATKLDGGGSGSTSEQTKTSSRGKRQSSAMVQSDQPNPLLNDVVYDSTRRKLFRDHYFISIQFEKTPYRNRILHEFLRQRDAKPMQYQQTREAEKLKRSLLNDFISRVHQRNTLIVLRLQIIQTYLSLTYLLHQFPLTSRSHFMWPKLILPTVPTAAEKAESAVASSVATEELTSNGYQHRPKRLLNERGTELVNLWYIPSFLEQLALFKSAKLDMNELQKRLEHLLRIVSSFNDLIHIIVGYAQLNTLAANAEQRFSERTNELSTFDQSGEFASELHEIQREIHSLSSTSLSTIADLLETKRRLTIFQIYFSIAYLIPNCFLHGKNQSAFNLVRSHSLPILQQFVGDYDRYRPIYSILPHPLLTVQTSAKHFYPWTVHEREYNINARRLWWPKYALVDLIHLCLIGLKPQELALANTEFVSTQIMLQNIDDIVKAKISGNHLTTILRQKEAPTNDDLSNYLRLELYITECIRLELARYAWCTAKLNVASINTLKIFDDAFTSYRDEVRSPILRQLSIANGYSNFYNDFPIALLNGQLAPNVTEYEYKHALIIRLLLELEGKFMMSDTLKVLKKERTLVLSERLREESSVSTDLWKKQQFTEMFTVLRPHILDELAKLLCDHEYKDEQSMPNSPAVIDTSKDNDGTITPSNSSRPSDVYRIRRSDLDICLKEIGTSIMQRERENYTSYSTYYENILYNVRQAMTVRENELKLLRAQLQDQQYTIEVESQLLALSAYFDLITELIQLRSSNAQLQIDKELCFDKELNQIREKFQSKTQDLLETNYELRQEFEKYREQLFDTTIKVVKEMRTAIHQSARTKLTSDTQNECQKKQAELIKLLQDELHENRERQLQETYETDREHRRHEVELEKTIAHLQYELNHHQKRYVYKTTKQVEEIQTLKKANNYLRKRITINEGQYKKVFETESKTENKANVERISDLRQALNQNQIIETKLRWMQEQSSQLILKDHELEKKTSEYERENQAMRLAQAYVKRDLVQTKKKLEQERSLKIDAFHQVETLRTNLNEIEEEFEQVVLNEGSNNMLSPSIIMQPSRGMTSARPVTPYQIFLTRNRPMTSNSMSVRDKTRLTNSRPRISSATSTKRPQTANVHIEKITPLTEELFANLGVSTQPATSSIRMLRIKSAKT